MEIKPSTGLPGLDEILHGIRLGDNIVWQVDSINDYQDLVTPFYKNALENGIKVVYFRFATHKELVPRNSGVEIHHLKPEAGFEAFITYIHDVIEKTGPGGYYVFDLFSELVRGWYSERMIGNFFMLTCPYLYKLDTVAYFALFRNYHSYHAAEPIKNTTQLLLDVCRYKDHLYIHPLKVDQRHSPTMYMQHRWENDKFIPVTESVSISEISTSAKWPGLQSSAYRMVGMWERQFIAAEKTLDLYTHGECSEETVNKVFDRLVVQLISRDERVLELVKKYMTLSDVLDTWRHTIGSGMIGGKSIGMLLARAIIRKDNPQLNDMLAAHESFYIGSDIFYMFLVQNDCWWIRKRQKSPEKLFEETEKARQRILRGKFPDNILRRFSDMLYYFGQSPIIVRSSSLLEDNFGNTFSGKYESVFLTNQGTHEQRLEEFINAVRVVYASAMSEDALAYRAKRGVLGHDEQMALLVQRVSGGIYGDLFYPQLAGVAYSFNPYAWHPDIEPEAGMMRLVFGLGTRAVDRSDDDYTRVVALNAPDKRPEDSVDSIRRYTQRRVDVLNLKENHFESDYFVDVVKQSPGLPVERFALRDREMERYARERNIKNIQSWMINFDRFLSESSFVKNMREMLNTVHNAYKCHVDIEFTANLSKNGGYKINLLQCRPFLIKQVDTVITIPKSIKPENLILEAHGCIVGLSRTHNIDRLIYVVPEVYGHLHQQDRYAVARLIGQLTHLDENDDKSIMLLGPGRWGTSTPSLGVPVTFTEINTVSMLCEIDTMAEGIIPDLSLGTHFFNELVEMDMLYIGFSNEKKENILNQDFLDTTANQFPDLLPDDASWAKSIRVFEPPQGKKIVLSADHLKQLAVVYLEDV